MTVAYEIGSRVRVEETGEYHGFTGVVTDYKAYASGFPGATTGWRYEVEFENGRKKWFYESLLRKKE